MKTFTYVCSYMSVMIFFLWFLFFLFFVLEKELIGAGLSEPHTSESNGGFFIYILYSTYVVRIPYASV